MSARVPDTRSQVWYIEARSCVPGNEFASEDAASMGSGVLVEIEHRDEPRKVRRYLLTCAHVVRRKIDGSGDWGGPVHDEILCWRPGQGYTRTYPGKRRCGEHPDIHAAALSALSPCGGRPDGLPDELRVASSDWVLLDIDDPAFQNEGRPLRWSALEEGTRVTIVGYPGGAGLSRHASGTRIWGNGSIVENLATGPFSQERTPEPGMLSLAGVDETRPGMSGGGLFDESGALVGLHRAADDMTMQRNAIAITHIRDALDTHRNASPTTPTAGPVLSKTSRIVLGAVAVLIVAASIGWIVVRPQPCLLQVRVTASPPARAVDALRENGVTESQLLSNDGIALLNLERMAPRERWSLSLRLRESDSTRIDLIGCPKVPGDYTLEGAHVAVAPQ